MNAAAGDVANRVLAVLKRTSPAPLEPRLESALVGDLGFDSLRLLEFVAELEDEFGICIPLNDLPQITTVGQTVDHVAALLQQQERPS
jgi:acyl carrier protein